MTTPVRLSEITRKLEQAERAKNFIQVELLLAEGRGHVSFAREKAAAARYPDEVTEILKADAGSIARPGTSPATYGAELAFQNCSAAFLGTLANMSVFDGALSAMPYRPMHSLAGVVVGGAVAIVVGEQGAKPVSELSLDAATLEPQKCAVLVVVSKDLISLGGERAESVVGGETRKAVAAATDARFLTTLIGATMPQASTGHLLVDLSDKLLPAVSGDATSKWFLVMSPTNLRRAALVPDAVGHHALRGLRVDGGSVAGITVLPSDALTDEVLLFDAAQVFADGGLLGLDASENAMIDMSGGDTPTFSLFQKNCVAVRAERTFGFQLARTTAVASVSGADYSFGPIGSPE